MGGRGYPKEIKEGWPLVTVVTEANGDSWISYTVKGCSSLAGLLGSCCFYNEICPVLVSPVQNIIFLTVHFFTLQVLISQQPGQAVVLGRQSLWSLGHPLSTAIHSDDDMSICKHFWSLSRV